jgi:hypothetical protein
MDFEIHYRVTDTVGADAIQRASEATAIRRA